MKIEHTQGNWIVKAWSSHDLAGDINACGYQVVAKEGDSETGIFSSCLEDPTDSELADLQLIAGAPRLLAMAKRFQEFARSGAFFGYPLGSVQELDELISLIETKHEA